MVYGLAALSYLILVYFGVMALCYTALLLASVPGLMQQYDEGKLQQVHEIIGLIGKTPVLTVIIPCFNEKSRVLNCIHSVLKGDYKNIELIVVDDESTDNTLQIMKNELELYEVPSIIKNTIETKRVKHVFKSQLFPNITVIEKEHGFGNAADNINVGVNASTTPLIMTLDSDTIVEREALSRLLFTFFSQPHCVVVGGSVYVLNEIEVKDGVMVKPFIPNHYITAFQSLEYIRSFVFGRSGYNSLRGALCYAGAFTLFEKHAVIEVGGFDRLNCAYDAEIVFRLHNYMRSHKYPYTAYFSSNAFSWTVVPATLKSYWRQRNLWQRGMLCTFFLHKKLLFNPRYGITGLFSVPMFFLFETLGPVVEFTSYLLVILSLFFHLFDPVPIVWALILAWAFATCLNLSNFLLNVITFHKYNQAIDILRGCYLMFAEMLGFRQFRSICCALATLQFFWNRLRGKYY